MTNQDSEALREALIELLEVEEWDACPSARRKAARKLAHEALSASPATQDVGRDAVLTAEAVEAAAKTFWGHPGRYGDEAPSWDSLAELEKRADIGPVRDGIMTAMRAALVAALRSTPQDAMTPEAIMGELIDVLAADPGTKIDPRMWEQLRIYAPQDAGGWQAMREALRPFAEYAVQMEAHWGAHDDSCFYGVKRPGAAQIRYGDFRRAAAAIRALPAPPEAGWQGMETAPFDAYVKAYFVVRRAERATPQPDPRDALIAQMREALRPFAEKGWSGNPSKYTLVEVDHCRQARAALSPQSDTGKSD